MNSPASSPRTKARSGRFNFASPLKPVRRAGLSIVALALLCLPGFLSSTQAEIAELTPSADTTIHGARARYNFGGRAVLKVGTVGEAEARALLRFDIGSAVPPGSTILGATLRLAPVGDPASAHELTEFALHRLTQFWNEGQGKSADILTLRSAEHVVTWRHQVYPNVKWRAPGARVGSDYLLRPSARAQGRGNGSLVFNSTPAIQRDLQLWLDRPNSNEGWILVDRAGSAGTLSSFASREDAKLAPQLVVEFTPPDELSDTPTANYEARFVAVWSPETHPNSYPSNAHWSGLVGGLHNSLVSFWRRGLSASEGIQRMAEVGNQTGLIAEVDTAIAQGTANRTLSGSGIGGGSGVAAVSFSIDRAHPLVTLTSMVAPSPDWFVGVRNLPLLERGRWVSRKTVNLFPYDAGTDSGATFRAPNEVTVPRGVISRIVTSPLANRRGKTRMIGTMTFRRTDNPPQLRGRPDPS
jgi:hypothetical protein